jgi:hypothetical protein
VSATQLTREAVEAHLFDKEPLPDGFILSRADYHPVDRKIWSFYARICKVPRNHEAPGTPVGIGDWRLEFADGHIEARVPEAFEREYEAAPVELLEALIALRSFMWAEGYADQTVAMAQADAAIAKAEGK